MDIFCVSQHLGWMGLNFCNSRCGAHSNFADGPFSNRQKITLNLVSQRIVVNSFVKFALCFSCRGEQGTRFEGILRQNEKAG